jgi:choline dehydrogenase-like flavoprotein
VTERVDVVVVGSGAGGAPVAYALARAGAKVLVLEKGPRHQARDFLHDEISSCRRDFWVPFPEADPHTLRRSPDARAHETNAGWISQCVGGGTVHMSGFFFRFHPDDFRLRSKYGPLTGSTVTDWPIDYATLAPFYDRIERELGVSGDVSKNPFEPPRDGNLPYPPVATHPVARWIDQAGADLGLHPYPVPRAILTAPKDGRQACVYCPLCGSYGCEVDAKSSTLASLLPAAEATGSCEIRPGCMVFDIPLARAGHARGARYLDAEGREREVQADVVVVAASAIESARLLLLSRSGRFPGGLGHQNGQVGKNLCFSTLTKLEGFIPKARLSPARQAELMATAPFVGRAVQDFLHLEPEGETFGKGGTFHLLWAHPNPIYAAEKLIMDGDRLVWGGELMERMHRRFTEGRMLEVEGFSEWLPTPGCGVDLDPHARDRWGFPAARITVARHPSDRAASARLAREARRLLAAVGAEAIETLEVGGETWVLQTGTCRMGEDPKTSVVDPRGRVHGVPNVYVSDGAALPTSGAVPCTETILANALRIGEHLARTGANP